MTALVESFRNLPRPTRRRLALAGYNTHTQQPWRGSAWRTTAGCTSARC